MSSPVCPLCGAPLDAQGAACLKCALEPTLVRRRPLLNTPAGLNADGARTRVVVTVFPSPDPSSTAAGVDTGRVAAPFPAEHSASTVDTGRVAAPFPVDVTPPAGTSRSAALFPVDVEPDAGTHRVSAPFRAVEAPFPVEPAGDASTARVSSSPFILSAKPVATQTSDRDLPVAGVPRVAPFPVESAVPPPAAAPAAPRKPLSKRERQLVITVVGLVIALGLVTVWLVGSNPGEPQHGVVRETTPASPVKAGYVRVSALCGGRQIPARLSVNGSHQGETPFELALPTAAPPGRQELELRLAGRIGEPVDARFVYHLPLDSSQPGKAIEIELNGCGGSSP